MPVFGDKTNQGIDCLIFINYLVTMIGLNNRLQFKFNLPLAKDIMSEWWLKGCFSFMFHVYKNRNKDGNKIKNIS